MVTAFILNIFKLDGHLNFISTIFEKLHEVSVNGHVKRCTNILMIGAKKYVKKNSKKKEQN